MMTLFNDLLSPNCELQDEIDAAALRVLHSGWYILGGEVSAFEAAFAAYHDVDHAIRVAGWHTETSLHDGLAKTAAYYRPNKKCIIGDLLDLPS